MNPKRAARPEWWTGSLGWPHRHHSSQWHILLPSRNGWRSSHACRKAARTWNEDMLVGVTMPVRCWAGVWAARKPAGQCVRKAGSWSPPWMKGETPISTVHSAVGRQGWKAGGAPISGQLICYKGRRLMAGSTARLGRSARNLQKCRGKWKSLSRVWFFATPSAIQSMEFSRPEYWSG